jgi:hypothetical protein
VTIAHRVVPPWSVEDLVWVRGERQPSGRRRSCCPPVAWHLTRVLGSSSSHPTVRDPDGTGSYAALYLKVGDEVVTHVGDQTMRHTAVARQESNIARDPV